MLYLLVIGGLGFASRQLLSSQGHGKEQSGRTGKENTRFWETSSRVEITNYGGVISIWERLYVHTDEKGRHTFFISNS